VRRVLIEKQTPKAVATAFGVYCKTVRKWVERFQAEGETGLPDRGSKPYHLRCPTSEETVGRILLRPSVRSG
jgi:transposase